MISTIINFTCDVEGCGSTAETKDIMGPGFAGLPKGWANLSWLMESKSNSSDPMNRFMKAVRKARQHLPPEMAELQDAGADLFVGEMSPQPVSCSATICDKCLDKINLGDFKAQSGHFLGGV